VVVDILATQNGMVTARSARIRFPVSLMQTGQIQSDALHIGSAIGPKFFFSDVAHGYCEIYLQFPLD
jgi:hypothetical protein